MDSKPFITIAIASYNYARYLQRAFETIKKQAFTDYEVLYVDDCSIDNSVELIKAFIAENPNMRIRLVENKSNMGLVYSKNRLIDESCGEYIMLCDADDWMENDCLEILANVAKNTRADRIIPQVKDIDYKGKLAQIQDFNMKQSKWIWNMHHGVLYKSKIIKDNNIRIHGYPDDVYFTTEFNLHAAKTVFVPRPLYTWFVHPDSAGRKHLFDNKFDEIIKTYTELFKFIDNRANCIMSLNEDSPVFEKGSKTQNLEELRLLTLKCFYLAILGELRRFPYRKMLSGYFLLRKNLKTVYRDYLHNRLLFKFSNSPMRFYATMIVNACAFFECLHVMPVVLFFYSIVCKFISFDQ